MANYQTLKNSIAQVIKTNGNQEITGQLLQNTLNSIVSSVGANYHFVGIAVPSTNPGTPDQNVFYLAGEGTYVNFSGLDIEAGHIGILKWDGVWSKQALEVSSGGGNMILDWNTNAETTRKQVLQKYRKPGLQISYNKNNAEWITEQYISTSISDSEWEKNNNWQQIPNQAQISELQNKISKADNDIAKINIDLYGSGGSGGSGGSDVEIYDLVWKGGKDKKRKYYYDRNGNETDISYLQNAGFFGITEIDVSNIIGEKLAILSLAVDNAYNLFVKNDRTVIERWQTSLDEEVVKVVPEESKYLLLTNYFSKSSGEDAQLNPYVKKVPEGGGPEGGGPEGEGPEGEGSGGLAIVKEFPAVKEKAEFAYNFIKAGGGTSPGGSTNHWVGKKWYAYGTSLTNIANEGKYAKHLQRLSGLVLVNKGISGGKITNNGNIARAVMNVTDGKLEASLITLEIGANDTGEILGDEYDTGIATFCGALNQCIRYLQEKTNAQIVVFSSTSSRYKFGDNSQKYNGTEKYGSDSHTILQMRQKIRAVCERNSCYYIPLGEGCGLGYARMNASNLYNYDQIHHTDLGGYNIAQFIWGRLKNIPLWYTSIPNI